MAESCKHAYEDAPSVFSDTARTRACRSCERIEVMLASSGKWVHIHEYMQQRVANRTPPVEQPLPGQRRQ